MTMAMLTVLPAHADDSDARSWWPDATLALRNDYYSSSRSLDDSRNWLGATGDLKLAWALNSGDRVDVDVRSGVYGIGQAQSFGNTQWINGYWLHKGEQVDWRIGQQRISWGRADAVNPTDFFTPHDYTVYLPLEEDQRLSVPAVRADVQVNDNDVLSLVGQPGFIPSRLPQSTQNPPQIDDHSATGGWHSAQWGARYNSTGANLDWALCGYRGYASLPLLSFAGINVNGPVFDQAEPKIWGAGGDLAHNFGSFGFRAELAYVRPDHTPGQQNVYPFYFLVTGIDHSVEDWNFNVQWVVHHTTGFIDPMAGNNPAAQAAATQNAILYGQLRPTEYGLTARVAVNWLNSTLQTELLTYFNFNPNNYLLRPLLTYAIDDQDKILFGGEFYSGPDASFFGELKRNKTLFLEYAHYFHS